MEQLIIEKLNELTEAIRGTGILLWMAGWAFTCGYIGLGDPDAMPVVVAVVMLPFLVPLWPLFLGAVLGGHVIFS